MIDDQWEERVELKDGTRLLLRMLRPSDAAALREGFARLSPDSRYRRFMTPLPALSDEMVRYLTDVDGDRHLAIVAGVESNDLKSEQGVAVARYVRLPDDPRVAEAAVTVVDEFQGKGLGKLMLTTLVRAAKERDIEKFRAEVLPENRPVQALLASLGAIERERGADCVIYDIPIPRGDDHEGPWQALFALLRQAASSVALVVRHRWFGRPPESGEPLPGTVGALERWPCAVSAFSRSGASRCWPASLSRPTSPAATPSRCLRPRPRRPPPSPRPPRLRASPRRP